jgi:hypothetical protein
MTTLVTTGMNPHINNMKGVIHRGTTVKGTTVVIEVEEMKV